MAAQGSHQTEKRLCVGLLAHVDAGKTTLSEAMLYQAGVIRAFGRVDHGDTFLDTDAQERSRGITIFSKQAVLPLPGCTLTLLDTPGHVDFSYEVSRSIAACEGALLIVDATQGIQAQTISNLYLALENNLEIIPVLNKMDMPNAMPEEVKDQIVELIGCKREEIIEASGYDPDRDLENPCGSVFCSHGAGYNVAWNEVPEHMHLESVLAKEIEEEEFDELTQRRAYQLIQRKSIGFLNKHFMQISIIKVNGRRRKQQGLYRIIIHLQKNHR